MSCGLMMLKSDLGVPATVYSDSSGETFQTGPTGKVRTVRKRGTERTALAYQRSAQVRIGTKYNGILRLSAVGAGWGSLHIQRSLRLMSRRDGIWGPRFFFLIIGRHPESSSFPSPRLFGSG